VVQPEIEARAESPSEKDQNSSIAILDPDESNQKRIFEAANAGLDPRFAGTGLTGAFAPAWSLDGQWIVFGVGSWFQERRPSKATVMRVRRDGSGLHLIVYRVWGEDAGGSRILRLEDRSTRVLTAEYDNPRAGRPTASGILFTRKVDDVNFAIYTIPPDDTDQLRLTTNRANDGGMDSGRQDHVK